MLGARRSTGFARRFVSGAVSLKRAERCLVSGGQLGLIEIERKLGNTGLGSVVNWVLEKGKTGLRWVE